MKQSANFIRNQTEFEFSWSVDINARLDLMMYWELTGLN